MVLGGRAILDFVVRASIGIAHHEGCHAVSAAIGKVVRALRRSEVIEVENAVGGIGLNVVHLVLAAFKAKFQLVVAQHFVQGKW